MRAVANSRPSASILAALEKRYGEAKSAADFAWKSQAMSYEGQRAMFEAYGRNKYKSTGIIQWMLNNAWPGLSGIFIVTICVPRADILVRRKPSTGACAIFAGRPHCRRGQRNTSRS